MANPGARSGWFWIPNTLGAIKSPMVLNAFSVGVLAALAYWGAQLPDLTYARLALLWFGALFIGGVTIWLNRLASVNPRFLTYGPAEYLRESVLANQRKMAFFEKHGRFPKQDEL